MTTEFRLFISINLTSDLLTTLTDLQNQLKRRLGPKPLRWARPEGIHLTLKFLGDTETGRIEEIARAIQQAVGPHQPFERDDSSKNQTVLKENRFHCIKSPIMVNYCNEIL